MAEGSGSHHALFSFGDGRAGHVIAQGYVLPKFPVNGAEAERKLILLLVLRQIPEPSGNQWDDEEQRRHAGRKYCSQAP